PVAREGSTETTRAGEQVFAAVGCAACHRPALSTGPSSNPLFDRKAVALFSDLLLHDVARATASCRVPPTPTKSARPHSGACACGGHCCTTARPQPPRRR